MFLRKKQTHSIKVLSDKCTQFRYSGIIVSAQDLIRTRGQTRTQSHPRRIWLERIALWKGFFVFFPACPATFTMTSFLLMHLTRITTRAHWRLFLANLWRLAFTLTRRLYFYRNAESFSLFGQILRAKLQRARSVASKSLGLWWLVCTWIASSQAGLLGNPTLVWTRFST